MLGEEPLSTVELRTLFISILRAAYENQIQAGELEKRQFLAISLVNSLDLAADEVAKGGTLQDWKHVILVERPVATLAKVWGKKAHVSLAYAHKRLKIERSIAFMAAHRYTQRIFEREFQEVDSEMSEAGKLVLRESELQFEKAAAVLDGYDPKDVSTVVSHKLCMVLLNGGIQYLGRLVHRGLLKEDEAEHLVEEVEHSLHEVLSCSAYVHPGERDFETGTVEED